MFFIRGTAKRAVEYALEPDAYEPVAVPLRAAVARLVRRAPADFKRIYDAWDQRFSSRSDLGGVCVQAFVMRINMMNAAVAAATVDPADYVAYNRVLRGIQDSIKSAKDFVAEWSEVIAEVVALFRLSLFAVTECDRVCLAERPGDEHTIRNVHANHIHQGVSAVSDAYYEFNLLLRMLEDARVSSSPVPDSDVE